MTGDLLGADDSPEHAGSTGRRQAVDRMLARLERAAAELRAALGPSVVHQVYETLDVIAGLRVALGDAGAIELESIYREARERTARLSAQRRAIRSP